MICDFCKHEVESVDTRELVISAWCPNCGAFSHGKGPLKLPKLAAIADTYRDTAKSAQAAGTNLWNTVVRVRNLLRVAQPYLEQDNMRCPDELELAALCNQIEKEIGSLEDNTTEEDGRKVAERLGIDIEKWAEEIRAKVEAATKEGESDQKEGA